MKPIGANDRPKVIALLVLSVLMIGYFVKTLLGAAAAKSNNKTPANPAPAPTPVAGSQGAPVASAGTPASSPSLSNIPIDGGGPENPFRRVLPEPGRLNPFPTAKLPKPQPGGLGGALPSGPISVGAGGDPLGVRPVGPAPVSEPVLRLDGVVSDRAHYAMVTVGEKTDMYRAGAKIAGLYEVISIDEFGASFRGPKGVFRLEVGQEHHPAEAAPAKPAGKDDARLMDGTGRSGTAPLLPLPVPDVALAPIRR